MTQANRPTNPAPGTVQEVDDKGIPQQQPGLPPGQNTPEIQRTAGPDVAVNEDLGVLDPNLDNESQNRMPIHQTIPSGAQPAGGGGVVDTGSTVTRHHPKSTDDAPEGSRHS
jgi:hypothetical protein